nr:response regulator [Azospirillaceae bacterium]
MARILLVEDEEDLRENLEIVLTHAGHAVTTAENGAEALKALRGGAPDLLITDLSMPVMDGMTLVRRLRDDMPALAEMPIIVLTALGDKAHMIEGRGAGADEYLAKPVDYQLLNATIKARLSRSRQATALKEKQFVRLFKQLSAQAPDAAEAERPAAPSDDPFDKIRALADAPLFGRSVVLFLDDHVPDYAGMPPATRAKAAGLMRRVLSDALGPGDAAIDLGAGAWLLAFAERNREIVDDKIALVRLHLDHVLGAENLGGGAGAAAGGGDGDDVRIDQETHLILAKLFVSTAQDDEDRAAARRADFAAVADRFHFEYEPIWRANSQKIEAYQLGWVRSVAGRPLRGDDALLGGGADPMAADLICLALEAALQDLRALAAQPTLGGAPPYVLAPIPAAALLGENSAKILQKLADIARCPEGKLIGFHVSSLSLDAVETATVAASPFAALFEVSNLVFHDFGAGWPVTAGQVGGDEHGPHDGADASRPRLT